MTDLRKRLQACIEDPMWADHAEVSKALLREVLGALPAAGGLTDAEIDALISEHADPVATYGGLRRLVLAAAGRAQPQIAAPAPERVALTDEQIDAIGLRYSDYDDASYFRVMARAIERAHGITAPAGKEGA